MYDSFSEECFVSAHKSFSYVLSNDCVWRFVDERKATHDAAVELGNNFVDSMYSLVLRVNLQKYDFQIGGQKQQRAAAGGADRHHHNERTSGGGMSSSMFGAD